MFAAHLLFTTPEEKTKQSDLKRVSGVSFSWGGVISNSSDVSTNCQVPDGMPNQKTPAPLKIVRGGWRNTALFPEEEQGTLTSGVTLKIQGRIMQRKPNKCEAGRRRQEKNKGEERGCVR